MKMNLQLLVPTGMCLWKLLRPESADKNKLLGWEGTCLVTVMAQETGKPRLESFTGTMGIHSLLGIIKQSNSLCPEYFR